ncbi:hypothetical protein BDV38DRAFT_274334 [Aspergillus pseudotamarii]|uniref:Uncharacterized protein n=1 Tax=Aspergillus pseudotamarii TaxID=132259 RepID=A0A5N6SF80_ASPPS|nr:uncharacterized protein BDV38DRAFT_274334 [Aspergillus pseudotamarii]KAE8133368.1 hypothetical protein BDV38DRAFT_274334 [Aspergillus pseudotamarii]
MRWPLVPLPNVIALAVTTTALYGYCLGAAGQGADDLVPSPAVGWIEKSKTIARLQTNNPSLDYFLVCTDLDGPFAPFCLPQDGADVVVDATYYVTWNADFYPLNVSITIEMRYSSSTVGDSAFTSEKTDNSYGYLPLYMRKEWLQEKAQNDLTLYLIELNPASGTRATYKPSPPMAFNKTALFTGLPLSLSAIIIVVAGKGYEVGKSKSQRLRKSRSEFYHPNAASALRKYTDDTDSGLLEVADADSYNEIERSARFAFKQDSTMRLKSRRK